MTTVNNFTSYFTITPDWLSEFLFYLERRLENKSLVSMIASMHEEAITAESKTITVVIII
jgi:hypothetical protein